MEPIYILLGIIIVFLIVVILLIRKASKTDDTLNPEIKYSLESLSKELIRIENSLKDEVKTNREEASQTAKNNREEISASVKDFAQLFSTTISDSFKQQNELLTTFSTKFDTLTKTIGDKLNLFQENYNSNSKDNREELRKGFENFKNDVQKALDSLKDSQKENFAGLLQSQKEMKETTETSIKNLQADNAEKLEKMRETVDEKLQKTLETKLGESFKLVSERLEAVHKGLGDMQTLATGVGDLKKMFSNVKIRGVMGEYQLENILEEILTPEQYLKNVKTKIGSNDNVEFAIKLPGKNDQNTPLLLPIDSKFHIEDYYAVVAAFEAGDKPAIEKAQHSFINSLKRSAKTIKEKYIDPPHTTDFAILFLPFESLYAEALRIPGLMEEIQREYKITITGPTTLSALLSSLSMGFRTLTIEKRSSEVWEVLGAVKTEFKNFEGILTKTKKKLEEAANVIDLAGVRSRAINKKLKNVEGLSQEQTHSLLGDFQVEEENTSNSETQKKFLDNNDLQNWSNDDFEA